MLSNKNDNISIFRENAKFTGYVMIGTEGMYTNFRQ